MRPSQLTPVALGLGLLLAACTTPEPVPTTPPTSVAPSPEPAEAGLLRCADLAGSDAIAAALTGSDGALPEPVEALQPSRAFDLALLSTTGGLACSWRVGDGQRTIGAADGDWAYLTIEVLAGGGAQWAPPLAGDSPSEARVDVSGIEAATTAGETGWQISAPVAEAWVDISLTSSGLITGESRFDGVPSEAVIEQLRVLAEQVFGVLLAAEPRQLLGDALPVREGDARCDGGLDRQGIAAALQLGDADVVDYVALDARTQRVDVLADAVAGRAGLFMCELITNGAGTTEIAVVRGHSAMIEQIGGIPDIADAVEPVALELAVEGEQAFVTVREDGPQAPVFFTVGDTFYQVYSDGAMAVAEAIIAQTR